MKATVLALALLTGAPAFAQSAGTPPDVVNAIVLGPLAASSLTFGVLTGLGLFGEKPPRNGFVINGIVFGAIALTYGGLFLGLNASDPRQKIGWIAASAGTLCIGLVVTGMSLFELVSMKRDGSWEGAPPPAPAAPAPPAIEAPPAPPPPPVFPTLAPTPDGRGVTLALVGRLP